MQEIERTIRLAQRMINQQAALITHSANSILPTLFNQFVLSTEILDRYRNIYESAHASLETLSTQINRAVDFEAIQATQLAAFRIAHESLLSDPFIKLRQRIHADEETIDAFKAGGWPISLSIPLSLRRKILGMHRDGKARHISQAIIGYYHQNGHKHLIETVDTWRENKSFLPRMQIIDDAVFAHRQGLYTLSIPTLLPQIEGILLGHGRELGLQANHSKIKKVYSAVIGDPLGYDLITWTIASTLLHHLSTNTYIFTDFDAELDKAASRRRATRHTILHGVTTSYAKPINSVRQFILLDAISVLDDPEG